MKKYIEELANYKNIDQLNRCLEEAEIMKSGMKLILMNPALNSERKREYEEAFLKLNATIGEMKIIMNYMRKESLARGA